MEGNNQENMATTASSSSSGSQAPLAAPGASATAASSGARAESGNGEGSSSSGACASTATETGPATSSLSCSPPTGSSHTRTLADVMRGPSRVPPGVVVLDSMPDSLDRKDVLDPKEDLWLSTSDGRYNSPIIPLRVGQAPDIETFYVHKRILLQCEYFEKALCGVFSEASAQAVELPEEKPALFHFLIAYLYEGKYRPIKSAAAALVPDQDKGKGREQDNGASSDSDDSIDSLGSDVSAISRRRRERRRRLEERHMERMRQKRPGAHRPNCGCPQCLTSSGPPCWNCQAPRVMPPPAPIANYPPIPDRRDLHVHETRGDRARRMARGRHPGPGPHPAAPPAPPGRLSDTKGSARISGEDLRTWLLTYELNIDVYILANKFLLDGLKKEIARATIDLLESAGPDAAVPEVLFLCRKLYEGVPEHDDLLKMIFARVGFLQPWRNAPGETQEFLIEHPEIASLLLREMAGRREEDLSGRHLPSMEPSFVPLVDPMNPYRAYHYHPYRAPPGRW